MPDFNGGCLQLSQRAENIFFMSNCTGDISSLSHWQVTSPNQLANCLISLPEEQEKWVTCEWTLPIENACSLSLPPYFFLNLNLICRPFQQMRQCACPFLACWLSARLFYLFFFFFKWRRIKTNSVSFLVYIETCCSLRGSSATISSCSSPNPKPAISSFWVQSLIGSWRSFCLM